MHRLIFRFVHEGVDIRVGAGVKMGREITDQKLYGLFVDNRHKIIACKGCRLI